MIFSMLHQRDMVIAPGVQNSLKKQVTDFLYKPLEKTINRLPPHEDFISGI